MALTPHSFEFGVASRWITNFAEALNLRDIESISSLFLPDGWLRDYLVFEWDLRTLHGRDQILAYLTENLQNRNKTSNFSDFAVSSDQYLQPAPGRLPGSVTSGFAFSTPIANGRGMITLVQESTKGEKKWKASTVFIVLDSIKGHEESDPLRDIYLRAPTWTEIRETEWKRASEEPEVLVIGAGQSGLQVAARLQQLRFPVLVVEKDERVGDVWRRRYPSLMLHTPKSHHTFLYQPFPSKWPDWTPRDKLADWLEQYAVSQDLLVWTKSRIIPRPTYDQEKKKWDVIIDKAGKSVNIHPKHIVVATGFLGAPYMPVINGQSQFQGRVLHSEGFPGGSEFKGKRCVVIGTGNSGADIALDLSIRGASSVLMVQRGSTCVQPATIVAEQLYMAYPENIPVEVSDFKYYATPTKRLFEILSQQRGQYWDREKGLIEGLQRAGMQVNMGPNNAGIFAEVNSRFAGFWMDVGCGEKIVSGQIKVKSGILIREFTENSLIFEDGSLVEADVVIFATGYQNMGGTLRNLLGSENLSSSVLLPFGLDEEGELAAAYRPTGHPGLWFATGAFSHARVLSKCLGIQLQALNLGYLTS